MATREASQMAVESGMSTARNLLLYRFQLYSVIVTRKHGLAVPFSLEYAVQMPDSELQSLVEALRDAAHLPPV